MLTVTCPSATTRAVRRHDDDAILPVEQDFAEQREGRDADADRDEREGAVEVPHGGGARAGDRAEAETLEFRLLPLHPVVKYPRLLVQPYPGNSRHVTCYLATRSVELVQNGCR